MTFQNLTMTVRKQRLGALEGGPSEIELERERELIARRPLAVGDSFKGSL